jgi:hydroxymethylpyrimidine kinase/phosphomethylpyrimidine kinase
VLPAALTIAGLDPSGGAGISADLRAFAAAGAWGAAVCAALTVQSTRGVRLVRPVAAALLRAQAEDVLGDAHVRAIKTGALGSAANVHVVTALIAAHPRIPAIVDPVMIPSRMRAPGHDAGSALKPPAPRLDGGVAALRRLARTATLVTPNLAEAGALLGEAVVSLDDARAAAAALVEAGAFAALVKGGHGRGDEAVDWLAIRGLAIRGHTIKIVRISRPRRRTPALHGTGCALASLIAGRLAALSSGRARLPAEAELIAAVRWARARLDRALRAPLITGHGLRVIDVT